MFYTLRWSFAPRAKLLHHKKASQKFGHGHKPDYEIDPWFQNSHASGNIMPNIKMVHVLLTTASFCLSPSICFPWFFCFLSLIYFLSLFLGPQFFPVWLVSSVSFSTQRHWPTPSFYFYFFFHTQVIELWMKYEAIKTIFLSSRGGSGVERWSDNWLHSAPMDQIPLGDVYVVKIRTKKELWTRYKLRGL